MTVTSRGCLHALAMWFSLCLLDNEEISTHTDCHGCWEQAIFPVNPQKLRQSKFSMSTYSVDRLSSLHPICVSYKTFMNFLSNFLLV